MKSTEISFRLRRLASESTGRSWTRQILPCLHRRVLLWGYCYRIEPNRRQLEHGKPIMLRLKEVMTLGTF